MTTVTVKEAAAELGLSPSSVMKRIHDGTFEARRVATAGRPMFVIERDGVYERARLGLLVQSGTAAATVENVEFLLSWHTPPGVIAERLGVSRNGITKTLRAAGRVDLLAAWNAEADRGRDEMRAYRGEAA